MGLKLRIDQEDVLVQECKRSTDRSAWIVRLFGAAGEDRKAGLRWTDGRPIKVWRSTSASNRLNRSLQRCAYPLGSWLHYALRPRTDKHACRQLQAPVPSF
jgi:hypothetical protein